MRNVCTVVSMDIYLSTKHIVSLWPKVQEDGHFFLRLSCDPLHKKIIRGRKKTTTKNKT